MPGSDTTLATPAPLEAGKQGPVEKELEAPGPSQAHQPEDYPDGGLRAWLVVLAGSAVTFATFGYISSFGVFQGYYQINQLADESPSNIAWIGSLQLFLIFFSGIFTGYLFDAGVFRPIVLTGSALLLIGIFTTAECTELWQFILAQGICAGLGCGLLFVPGAATVSHWFKKRRALAYGIIACGSSIGGVLFPILLSRLFMEVGFKWAVRVAGFVVLACLAIVNAFLKPRLPARTGGSLLEFHHLKDPVYSLFCVAAFLIILGLYTPIFYISSYAQSKGVGEELSFYILAILNAASLFGRLIPNLFADKLGPSNILWPASLISGILCFCWLGTSSTGGIIAFAVVYGPASGSYVATIPAVISNITKNMNEIGARTSLAFGIISFASLIGTPVTGALYKTGGWVGPACFAGAVVLLGVAFGLWSRHLTVKRYGTWRV